MRQPCRTDVSRCAFPSTPLASSSGVACGWAGWARTMQCTFVATPSHMVCRGRSAQPGVLMLGSSIWINGTFPARGAYTAGWNLTDYELKTLKVFGATRGALFKIVRQRSCVAPASNNAARLLQAVRVFCVPPQSSRLKVHGVPPPLSSLPLFLSIGLSACLPVSV